MNKWHHSPPPAANGSGAQMSKLESDWKVEAERLNY